MGAPNHSRGGFVGHARYSAAQRYFLADVIPRIRVVCVKWNNQDREQEAGQQPRDQWDQTDETTMPHGFAPLSASLRDFEPCSDNSTADTRLTQPLNMEKCAFNLASAPLVPLLLQPCSLSRDNFVRLKADHGESLDSFKDDNVLDFCTICIEERAGTIWIDRVASVRPRDIGPVVGFGVADSGRASDAARPVSVKEVEAHLGNRATHGFVRARPAPGIGPFESGNATGAIVRMNVDDSPRNASKSRKERETCHEKKILSELAHF